MIIKHSIPKLASNRWTEQHTLEAVYEHNNMYKGDFAYPLGRPV